MEKVQLWKNLKNYDGNVVESIREEKPASAYRERIAGIKHVTFAEIMIGFTRSPIIPPHYKAIENVTGQETWEYLCRYTQDTIRNFTLGQINQSLGDIKVEAEIRKKNGLYLIELSTRNIPNLKVGYLLMRVSEQQTFIERAKMDLGTLVNAVLRR